jgi:hypothetical protein
VYALYELMARPELEFCNSRLLLGISEIFRPFWERSSICNTDYLSYIIRNDVHRYCFCMIGLARITKEMF